MERVKVATTEIQQAGGGSRRKGLRERCLDRGGRATSEADIILRETSPTVEKNIADLDASNYDLGLNLSPSFVPLSCPAASRILSASFFWSCNFFFLSFLSLARLLTSLTSPTTIGTATGAKRGV
jgi:hypothetical protein